MKAFFVMTVFAVMTNSVFAQAATFPDKVGVFKKAMTSQIAFTDTTSGRHEVLSDSLARDLAEHPNPGKGVAFHAICETAYTEVEGKTLSSCDLKIKRVWKRGNETITIYKIILVKDGNEDVIESVSRLEDDVQ